MTILTSASERKGMGAANRAIRGDGLYARTTAVLRPDGAAKEEHETRKRTREDMLKHIDCDYYGFRDDEDEQMIKDEVEVENKLRKRALMIGTLPTLDTTRK
ncbi:hypothetical protein PsorP6_001988 [Peronosclerospora sorghi]|uniref:Uncharacterized protein n=1 Tax=Peronosclerospora sorghi TaxID=230839 RepID=A0ACC0WU96_9STRA|nr:hypothetical protein PsorP6_001988 [Peronosclerospora sorghi]